MSSTEKTVIEKYQNGEEENRAVLSRYSGIEFHYTKKHLNEYITPETKVIEIGCGTGYYAMYCSDKCKEYTGVDITPENITKFKEKIKNKNLKNVTAQIGNAVNLREIHSSSFDIVLCLGPCYHLPPEERQQVFAESKRILRDGGIAAFAYINRVGVYNGGCIHDQFREQYPSQKANKYILELNKDDLNPDLFFYTMPEEIEAEAGRHGFEKIKNLGTNFFITMSIIETMSDEKFQLLKPLLNQMTTHESCTGMSNHALLICRKLKQPEKPSGCVINKRQTTV